MSEFYYIKSEKGRNMLVNEGFLFKLDRVNDKKTIWRCTEYSKSKCSSRIHVQEEQIVKKCEHNHRPDIAKIEAKKAIYEMKEIAKTSELSTQAVLGTISKEITEAVAGQLPPVESLKKTVRRVRKNKLIAPANPKTLDDLIVPVEYTTTVDGKPFLLFDSFEETRDKPRFLIFWTEENLNIMVDCKVWYIDGTFSTAPTIFYQLFSIHGIQYSNVLPSIFALLPNKTEEIYVRLFQIIIKLKPELKPESIMLDFEQASINAVRKVFPQCSLNGCFFHFSQSLWRHIQNTRLSIEYCENAEFALNIRMLNALAFVPKPHVIKAYEAILNTDFYIQNDAILTPFLNYFEDTWIGRNTRNRRRNPKFPIELWNCFDLVENNMPRTNNSIEGWHNSFISILNAVHPSIWKFIDALKKEEKLNRLKIHQFVAGNEPKPKKKCYKDTALRLKNICSEFNVRPIEAYLKGIAQNI